MARLRKPSNRMEKEFRREIGALDEVFEFVDNFVAAHQVEEAAAFDVRLAAEELFTNLVRHNAGGLDHVTVCLDREGERLILRLEDSNVEPFDPSGARLAEVGKPLSERSPGGLGIRLVKNVTDELTYEYKDRTLYVTAIKDLGRKDV